LARIGFVKCRENTATYRVNDVIAFPGSTLTPGTILRDCTFSFPRLDGKVCGRNNVFF